MSTRSSVMNATVGGEYFDQESYFRLSIGVGLNIELWIMFFLHVTIVTTCTTGSFVWKLTNMRNIISKS